MPLTNKKELKGVGARLQNLLEGQNKDPYSSTLKKLWNNGYCGGVNQKFIRECTLHEKLHKLRIKNSK